MKFLKSKTCKNLAYTAAGIACWFLPSPIFNKGKWVPDNFLEEKVEQIIKEKTGMDIDFTPATPEEKK